MTEIIKQTEAVFERIKYIDENDREYWLARELMLALEYKEWRNFQKVIDRAKVACQLANNEISDHFVDLNKMVKTGDSFRKIKDYKLSRYACYLIVQNGNPNKKVIALGQSYFAIQTRKQELQEINFADLSEDVKRLYTRMSVRNKNKLLFSRARDAGVTDFAKFNNYGYMGLYNGETEDDIHKRKNLKKDEEILDYMNSEELAANLFRITQTESKLKRDNVKQEDDACDTHYVVGKTVRKAIQEIGGTMPEKLPIPDKSISELENKKQKQLQKKESI